MRIAIAVLLSLVLTTAVCAQQGNPELTPEAIKARILQHRATKASVTVTSPDGRPVPNLKVIIRQTRHKFLFGSNAFAINPADTSQLQQDYQKRFTDLLNFATLPFYWGTYEPVENRPAVDRLQAMARWCLANGIRPKGHPLVWQQVPPAWLIGRSADDVQRIQIARVARDVTRFNGLVDTWDVVNEAVAMPTFKGENSPIPEMAQKVGIVELIKQAFTAARAANPKATLILNDYDTSPRYEKLIQECLDAGVPIDVIGIQCHQHAGYWGAQRTWDVCQRFSKFNKPLHFTELTIVSGENRKSINYRGRNPEWPSTPEGEKRQAQQVAEYYSILFSHPAVQAITWWDFSDNRAWLGAPAGLIGKDMKPKPAYTALMNLVKKEWWTQDVRATTDGAGKVVFTGFLGDYTLTTDAGEATFRLDSAGQDAAIARLGAK